MAGGAASTVINTIEPRIRECHSWLPAPKFSRRNRRRAWQRGHGASIAGRIHYLQGPFELRVGAQHVPPSCARSISNAGMHSHDDAAAVRLLGLLVEQLRLRGQGGGLVDQIV